tara:strand:+ start:160 stop:519 length:360 start_codon:yes stop_codon:yes gene_type:complete
VVKFLESFSFGDPYKVVDHVTDGFKNRQMGLLANSFEGKQEYLSRLHPFLNKFKNLRYEIRKVISEDSNVVVEYTLHATPEEHDICVNGVMVFVVDDSLISERSDYWDGLTYLRQVGLY